MALFGTRGFELCTGRGKAARAEFYDRVGERPRYIANFLVQWQIAIKRSVARRIRLVITDDPIQSRLESRVNQSHPVEPVRKRMAHALDSRDVTVNLESSGRQKILWFRSRILRGARDRILFCRCTSTKQCGRCAEPR